MELSVQRGVVMQNQEEGLMKGSGASEHQQLCEAPYLGKVSTVWSELKKST